MTAEISIRLQKLSPNGATIDLDLQRIEQLLGKCGHPERHLPNPIHVAGTNGKGSTLAFIRAGLESAKHLVHAYTSPHLISLTESFLVASKCLDENVLNALLIEIESINDGAPLTMFEAETAAAFLAFARTSASYTLIEVGMGGRLDATNVSLLAPKVCAITPISLDHQR